MFYATLYKSYSNLYWSSSNFEVAGGVVAFGVKHSHEFVLETLGDERIHHEWDVLGGHRKLYTFKEYSTGGDCRNNVSASKIEGSSDEILIKEVDVNQTGSLVMWSTVSKKDFDLIRNGGGVSEDSVLISGFSISTDGHTTATNTGGSVITLVWRMLVDGNQPLQEKRQQSIQSITFAINKTVERVKEALEKPRPPSPSRGYWQQVGAYDIASEYRQDELRCGTCSVGYSLANSQDFGAACMRAGTLVVVFRAFDACGDIIARGNTMGLVEDIMGLSSLAGVWCGTQPVCGNREGIEVPSTLGTLGTRPGNGRGSNGRVGGGFVRCGSAYLDDASWIAMAYALVGFADWLAEALLFVRLARAVTTVDTWEEDYVGDKSH
ncbi:hypothetical protein Tco_0593169 [Tanacetum coccineum]